MADRASTKASAERAYEGPPDYRLTGRHGVSPSVSHDEAERYNFLAQLNRHLSVHVMPGVAEAYEARVKPRFKKRHARLPEHRNEVRKGLVEDGMFQFWSALRRNTMEMRQQAGLSVVLRQLDQLQEKTRGWLDKAGEGALKLDPEQGVPDYLSAVDHHCMPGSYHTELVPEDVSGAANYDSGLFVTTGGALGRYSDGGGQALVQWLRRSYPEFSPRRILDLGCGLGHNVIPIAQAFPEARIVAVDTGVPMLRYGAARAASMGVTNISFVQVNAEDLGRFPDHSFDWIQTTMFLHETSYKGMAKIMAETRRLLAPGGLVLHVEQPQYGEDMPVFEQAMRDWDAFYNNEPFWTKLHEIDLDAAMVKAGFSPAEIIHDQVTAVVDRELFPDAADDDAEDFGRKPSWHLIGAKVA